MDTREGRNPSHREEGLGLREKINKNPINFSYLRHMGLLLLLQEGDTQEADIPWEVCLPPALLWSEQR